LTLASAAVAELAQRLYIAHITFLKAEIKALEEEFLRNYKDIEDIERGDWDDKFKAQIDAETRLWRMWRWGMTGRPDGIARIGIGVRM
jgi:hypothetical protein